MVFLTRSQRVALKHLWARDNQDKSYRDFRSTVTLLLGGGCIMVFWCDMWVGIEPDGYTHT